MKLLLVYVPHLALFSVRSDYFNSVSLSLTNHSKTLKRSFQNVLTYSRCRHHTAPTGLFSLLLTPTSRHIPASLSHTSRRPFSASATSSVPSASCWQVSGQCKQLRRVLCSLPAAASCDVLILMSGPCDVSTVPREFRIYILFSPLQQNVI